MWDVRGALGRVAESCVGRNRSVPAFGASIIIFIIHHHHQTYIIIIIIIIIIILAFLTQAERHFHSWPVCSIFLRGHANKLWPYTLKLLWPARSLCICTSLQPDSSQNRAGKLSEFFTKTR